MPTREQFAIDVLQAIDRWCPEQFHGEPRDEKLVLAFLTAIACVDDLRAQLQGEEPIRTDYPDPAWAPKG